MSRSAVMLARLAAPSPAAATDVQLLRAFDASRTDDAFAELVRRHGPMVLAVCRRVLSDAHDAEDAFQAVFLVLARKAGTVRGANVAAWLYGVAVRTARGVRVMRDRRKHTLQSFGAGARDQKSTASAAPDTALVFMERAAIIDEELAKLPECYREAVVLCELRGLSRKRAAAELCVPEGTLSSRLATAKRKLAERLAARGVAGAVLAAALAPAVVSAALLESTALAVRGAAGGVANAAASAVVKGMLFDQLKAVVLTTALCLAAVGGGLAMTDAPADEPPGKAAAPAPRVAEDPAAKLVEQLGSADFTDREAAAKGLRKMGMKAEAALRAGLRSDDPEVRTRSAEVLKQVREAERQAFLTGKAEPAGPAWKRFKELLGDTEASRKLFVEMMHDDKRAQTVEKAEANPDKAAEVYAAEVTRLDGIGLKSFEQFIGRPAAPAVPGGANDPIAVASRRDIPLGDVIALLFLGTRPLPKDAKDPSASWALRASFADGTVGPLKEPFRKLFAAWIDQRRDPATVRDALETALFAGLPEILPTARRLAADTKLPPRAKGLALIALGNHGTLDDLPLLTAHLTDDRAYSGYPSFDTKKYELQVRDAAVAMSLHLRGEDYEKYGFERCDWMVWWLTANPAPLKDVHWFKTDKERDAAHKKAREWLDKQKDTPKPDGPKKEEPQPDPAPALVKQLGSDDFAAREAAGQALRELGAAAKPAVLVGLKSDNPEVVRRCQALLPVLRKSDWLRARDAHTRNPAAFDHPVWAKLKTVAGVGPDARAILADVLADERSFVAIVEALDNPKAADRLHRQALARLVGDLKDWHDANPNGRPSLPPPATWMPDRGAYAAMLLLGTFPGTGAGPTSPQAQLSRSWEESATWNMSSQGLWDEKTPPSAALRRLFVAWLGDRSNRDVLLPAFFQLRRVGGAEALPLARAVAADRSGPVGVRAEAVLYLGTAGTAADVPLVAALFGDATEVAPLRERPVQVRDVATAVALKLHGLDPVDFGFSVNRGENALREWQHLGFTSDVVREPVLKAAQKAVAERSAADRVAPPPRPKP